MKDGSIKALKECGVRDENIIQIEVPGSYELTFAAKSVIGKQL